MVRMIEVLWNTLSTFVVLCVTINLPVLHFYSLGYSHCLHCLDAHVYVLQDVTIAVYLHTPPYLLLSAILARAT